ncbi:MAG: hypothetical protein IIA89_13405 [Chloroflexi bacterium]|nr:hypothetical protein [Chloroflexota bacterium]
MYPRTEKSATPQETEAIIEGLREAADDLEECRGQLSALKVPSNRQLGYGMGSPGAIKKAVSDRLAQIESIIRAALEPVDLFE